MAEEYGAIEKDIKVAAGEYNGERRVAIDEMTSWNLVAALCASPHGVLAMSQEIENFVETSTNLASVKMPEPGLIRIGSSQRRCVTAARRAAAAKMEACFELAGAIVRHESEYPGWAPAAESPVSRKDRFLRCELKYPEQDSSFALLWHSKRKISKSFSIESL